MNKYDFSRLSSPCYHVWEGERVLGGMGCLRMMILPISKDQISANSNPFLISEDEYWFDCRVDLYLYPYSYCGDGPSDAPNKLTPRLVLTTRVRHELPCEQ